ncbi:MAG: alpha/beta hydrolase domain-containing protein [Acidimicrobiales bacterium]|nr:alpha/beta hydrolase domain-containing protein [Acidimicrobiales bacterium]
MPSSLATDYGYSEQEYFVRGHASAFREIGEWNTDGNWAVEPAERAPFTTRMIVRRPIDPARFDGTVIIEWLNVSSGQDVDVIFAHAHTELLRHGTVWVGVSAQRVGVEGGGATMTPPGVVPTPLKQWDPERYASLSHPGDDFSYDIFSQAAIALVRRDGSDPLAGLEPRSLIAAGESQSAARMVTYANAIQPLAKIFDGFLIHSRSSGGSVLRHDPVAQPAYAWIRADLGVPVLQFETETDILGLPFLPARQPDTDSLRTWEVAGTAHLDQSLIDYRTSAARPWDPPPGDALTQACGAINRGPQAAVLRKAIASLRDWVVGGEPPAHSPQIEVRDGAIVRDELGIAVGGIRTPPVDAPVATLRGDNVTGVGYICALFGSTVPFSPDQLNRLYASREDYVAKVRASAESAVANGHLLPEDAAAFIEQAEQIELGQ